MFKNIRCYGIHFILRVAGVTGIHVTHYIDFGYLGLPTGTRQEPTGGSWVLKTHAGYPSAVLLGENPTRPAFWRGLGYPDQEKRLNLGGKRESAWERGGDESMGRYLIWSVDY
jgi:hypothetical protein